MREEKKKKKPLPGFALSPPHPTPPSPKPDSFHLGRKQF